jgi:hypothetical protein
MMELYKKKNTTVVGGKDVPVPLHPPQIPQKQNYNFCSLHHEPAAVFVHKRDKNSRQSL